MRKKRIHLRTSSSSGTQRRRTPLMLIGVGVTLVVALSAGLVVVLPRLIASHAAAAVNADCTLLVPNNPLSAQGLATPFQLSATNPANGPCNEGNANQTAFVQGVIYNPATGAFSVYDPLVVDAGTQPAVAPKAPTLPQRAVVALWFGFNANNLTLKGASRFTLWQAGCVNGLPGSIFGQFSYCNAINFFRAVNQGIAQGKVKVPALQTAKDGKPCLTTRDFGLVDQDQSDNVQTTYLVNANGQTAQFSAANQAQMANATVLGNPSDNALLTNFVDPALGCTPWMAPDLANNNTMVPALPLDEIQAAADQKAPIALVPVNDPMTLDNNRANLLKTNLYRMGVDQPWAFSQAQASGTTYCKNLVQTGLPRLQLDQTLTTNAPSPDAGAANSLYTFLMMRWQQSYGNLGCQNLLNQPNPVTLQTDANGVVIGATVNTGGNNNGGTQATPTAAPAGGNGGTQATPTATPAGGNNNGGTPTATPTAGTNNGTP